MLPRVVPPLLMPGWSPHDPQVTLDTSTTGLVFGGTWLTSSPDKYAWGGGGTNVSGIDFAATGTRLDVPLFGNSANNWTVTVDGVSVNPPVPSGAYTTVTLFQGPHKTRQVSLRCSAGHVKLSGFGTLWGRRPSVGYAFGLGPNYAVKDDINSVDSRSFIRHDDSLKLVTVAGGYDSFPGLNGAGTCGYLRLKATTTTVAVWCQQSGQLNNTWAGSTGDVRALQKPAPATDRAATCWYNATSFTADLTISGTHRVGLYFDDWDARGRAQTVDVIDGDTGAVLDTRSVSSFVGGTWLSWDLSGHVKFRITRTAGDNAVLSGIFFGAAPADTTGARVTASAYSGAAAGTFDKVRLTFSEPIDPNTFDATDVVSFTGPNGSIGGSFTVTPVAGSGNRQFDVAFAAQSAAGSYTLTVGPDIKDVAGNQMDQNQNGTNGEVPADRYAATGTLTSNAAKYVSTDTSTQGSWRGVYGADGQSISQLSPSLPAYATLGFSGQLNNTWAGSTGDVRALQKPAPATDRTSTCWYSFSSFTADLILTGGTHRVGLYFDDWDARGRAQTVDVIDGDTGAVLDTRSVSSFVGGTWLSWDLSGHVKFRITRAAGDNAVLSGIFFGGAPVDTTGPRATASAFSGAAAGTFDKVRLTFSEPIDPNTFTTTDIVGLVGPNGAYGGSFTVTPVAGSGNTQFDVGFAAQSVLGAYTLTVGPDVRDVAGNQMDQNQNGTNGEIPADRYAAAGTLVQNGATFLGTDTTTQGSWGSAYGADGYSISQVGASLPAYATLTFSSGQSLRLVVDNVTQVAGITEASGGRWDWIVWSGLDGSAEHEYRIVLDSHEPASLFAWQAAVGGTLNTGALAAPPKLVAFYGDSITAGTGVTYPSLGYAFQTMLALGYGGRVAGLDGRSVRNYGAGGSSPGGGESGEADVARSLTAYGTAYDSILVLLGTNDAGAIYGAFNAANVQSSYSTMLTALRTAYPSAKIRCLGMLPVASSATNYYANRSATNTAISAAVTAAADANITYHSTDGVIDPTTDTGDGIHPNAAGVAKIVTFASGVLP